MFAVLLSIAPVRLGLVWAEMLRISTMQDLLPSFCGNVHHTQGMRCGSSKRAMQLP